MSRNKNHHTAFTLLEILLVVAAIAILATIVIVAINPQRQLQTFRDTQRESHLNALNSAIIQYQIDHGSYPEGITTSIKEICATAGEQDVEDEECGDLINLSVLVPTYLSRIPHDPIASPQAFVPQAHAQAYQGTGYFAAIGEAQRLYLEAPGAETKVVEIGFSSALAAGGVVTEAGGYVIHAFTSSDTFRVRADSLEVEYLVVGGGGGGGRHSGYAGAGGGAGGLLKHVDGEAGNTSAEKLTLTPDSYDVAIGAGGAGSGSNSNGTNGSDTTALGLTALGGGGGSGAATVGVGGGSGSGGRGTQNDPAGRASGPTPGAGTPPQGNDGGTGWQSSVAAERAGGGGGGADSAGGAASSGVGGTGGNPKESAITGVATNYSRGGDGGTGSGNGATGAANTGSAGGGAFTGTSGTGGSGIVVIRYSIIVE